VGFSAGDQNLLADVLGGKVQMLATADGKYPHSPQ
jgi:hypothetical protein